MLYILYTEHPWKSSTPSEWSFPVKSYDYDYDYDYFIIILFVEKHNDQSFQNLSLLKSWILPR